MRIKSKIRERFLLKAASGKLLSVSNEQWKTLDSLWTGEVQEEVKNWQRKLDCSLPGRLGSIVTWLYGVEQLVEIDHEPCEDWKKMVDSISTHLEQIKASFTDSHIIYEAFKRPFV